VNGSSRFVAHHGQRFDAITARELWMHSESGVLRRIAPANAIIFIATSDYKSMHSGLKHAESQTTHAQGAIKFEA
jgi:hypothetical protein